MSALKEIYHLLIPSGIRLKIYNKRAKMNDEKIKNKILDFYKENPSTDPEINEGLKYLEKNPISVFPYSFFPGYFQKKIEVHIDSRNNFPYVIHGNNKLYFKKDWTNDRIISSYQMLLAEQDKNSPHYYFDDNFKIEPGSVVVDVGAAEGIFALNQIEEISHLYLIETDPEWIDTLRLTYEKWLNKITIIKKFVSNTDDETNVKIDTYFKDFERIDFLKIDVDGAEQELIYGGDQTISLKTKKLVICTYHKPQDYEDFSLYLKQKKFKINNSKRYMLYYYFEDFVAPYFRRGVIKAEK